MFWIPLAALVMGLLASSAPAPQKPQKRGKKGSSMQNVIRWLPELKAAHLAYPGVSISLACAIMENESGGSPNAVRWECKKADGTLYGGKTPCEAGCQRKDKQGRPIMSTGMWQFLIATGESYGLHSTVDAATDERRDPAKSTKAAFKFLSSLLASFPGDENAAIAAYNAGAGGVHGYQKKHGGKGVPNQSYVDHINAKRAKYRHLDGGV